MDDQAVSPSETSDPATVQRHVAPDGDDTADGSESAPWAGLQHAVDTAPTGARILVEPGQYDGFVLSREVHVVGADRDGVVVRPLTPRRDVVIVNAADASLEHLTVADCEPVRMPADGLDDDASSGIRVDNVDGVVVRDVLVRDGAARDDPLPFGCHGIYLRDANDTLVADSEITGNGSGVFVVGGGTDVVIRDNYIHGNDVLVRNDVEPNNDFGATAINFTRTGVSPGPLAEGNRLEDNQGPSADYGTDGAGFEIFQSAGVTMRRNTLRDNDVVIETGSSGPDFTCADNVFSDNVVLPSPEDPRAQGLILRCGMDMEVARNTIGELAQAAFVLTPGDFFGSSIEGMRIQDNKVTQGPRQVWSVEGRPGSFGAEVDGNRYVRDDYSILLATVTLPGGRVVDVPTLSDWQSLTGWDASGVELAP